MKYYYFLDESGDHSLSFIDKNFPVFLLCGILISESEFLEFTKKINEFKQKYFKTAEVILHSRDIRKCDGPFQILFNLELKKNFYDDLNNILKSTKFTVLASCIDKEEHIKKFGKSAKNPYLISTSFIAERMIFITDSISKNISIEIFIESRGKKEDKQLLEYLNNIQDKGTYYVTAERFREKIERIHYKNKRDNNTGLQLADLIAYPLARYIINPKMPNPSFDVFKDKIYTDKKSGKFMGWGIKCFP